MERVNGMAGVSHRAENPESLRKWYADNLDNPADNPIELFEPPK